MGKLKNIILILFVFLFFTNKSDCATVWINDLRTIFLSNNAVIYAVNIRTFNAKDKNGDEIIDEMQGEESGNFLNATERLDELVSNGVNTVILMPVTTVGRVKALGTAGSLYAPSSFTEINPQLKSNTPNSTAYSEMRKFVQECHNKDLRVIVDMPSCASYDLYLLHPELFIKDKNQNPVIPADWTDVRLLDAGSEEQINNDVYNMYSDFVRLMMELDVDGIRANVATIKPFSFWKKLIEETRLRNPQFLFLAQASEKSSPTNQCPVFTPYQKLLDAGFDGYYGTYDSIVNWKTPDDLYKSVKSDIEIAKKYSDKISVIGNFATHDQISPMLVKGPVFSKMIIWLSTTLPLNAYYIDGFPTGDTYIYPWANKKASISYTDDDYYFVHRGQLDIFNFSRKPEGKFKDISQDFLMANRFKIVARNVLGKGSFNTLRTTSQKVFAYARNKGNDYVVVYGNLDFSSVQKVSVCLPKMSEHAVSLPVKIESLPIISLNKIDAQLLPGEIQVVYFGYDPNFKAKKQKRFWVSTTTEVVPTIQKNFKPGKTVEKKAKSALKKVQPKFFKKKSK